MRSFGFMFDSVVVLLKILHLLRFEERPNCREVDQPCAQMEAPQTYAYILCTMAGCSHADTDGSVLFWFRTTVKLSETIFYVVDLLDEQFSDKSFSVTS